LYDKRSIKKIFYLYKLEFFCSRKLNNHIGSHAILLRSQSFTLERRSRFT